MRAAKIGSWMTWGVLAALVLTGSAAWSQNLPGITAFPDNDATSGRFMNITRGFSSLGEAGTQIAVDVPVISDQAPFFRIGIYDGDVFNVGYDPDGSTAQTQCYYKPVSDVPGKAIIGYWDAGNPNVAAYLQDQVSYELYRSPGGTIIGAPVETWHSWDMEDDAWELFDPVLDPLALSPDGTKYQYTLVLRWNSANQVHIQNNFKIQVTGSLRLLTGSSYGFIGYSPNDPSPQWYPQPPGYDGNWHFMVSIPAGLSELTLWDGDLDRYQDDDDPLFSGKPSGFVISPTVVNEGARTGSPADNAPTNPKVTVGGPIAVQVTDPTHQWTVLKDNPSGDKEWEPFTIGTGVTPVHAVVPSLPGGNYNWEVTGADGRNTLFIAAPYDIVSELGEVGDLVWLDANEDGIQNLDAAGTPTEPGVAGVTVELWAADGYLIDTQETDANGNYLFGGLAQGSYRVRFNLPAGYEWTLADQGGESEDSDAAASSPSDATATASGFATLETGNDRDLTWDAGLVKVEPMIDITKTGGKLGASTRTIGFWKTNISKHRNCQSGTQVSKTDLVNWLTAVHGYYLSKVLGKTDGALVYKNPASANQYFDNALSILGYTGSDIVRKTKRQLLAVELNWVSGFALADPALHEAFIKRVEDALSSSQSSAVLTPLHDMCDKINNAGETQQGAVLKTGSFLVYTIEVTATDLPGGETYEVTDKLDSSLQFVSATGGATFSSSTKTVRWTITPPAGDSVTVLRVAVRVNGYATGSNYPGTDLAGWQYTDWVTMVYGSTLDLITSGLAASSQQCEKPYRNRAGLHKITVCP